MNTLPPEIINIFFIPKYLDRKYHKYSIQFKMDIYHTSQKYKNVVNEFNRHIKLFNKENLFKYQPNLNYFCKLHEISLTIFNIKQIDYKIYCHNSYWTNKSDFRLPIAGYWDAEAPDENKFITLNGFVVKNEELSELWENMLCFW